MRTTTSRFARGLSLAIATALLVLAGPQAAQADLVWSLDANGDWNSSGSWTPSGIPGAADTAVFQNTGVTAGRIVTLGTDVASIVNVTGTYGWTWQTGALAVGSSFNYGSTGTSLFSGALNGTGALSVTAGVLSLTGSNNYGGGTTLSGGRLDVEHANALGTGTLTISGTNAILGRRQIAGLTNTTVTVNNTVVIDGNFSFVQSTGGAGSDKANLELAGPVSLGTAAGTSRTITVNNHAAYLGSSLIISGTLSDGTTATNLVKAGPGILVLSGNNSTGYTGTTTISDGNLRFGSAASIGGSGASVTVTGAGAAVAGYAINQAFLDRITTSSTGVVALGVDSANDLDFTSWTGLSLGSGYGTNVTYSGNLTTTGGTYRLGGGGGTLTVSQPLTGANSVVHKGGGTVVLSGDSDYSGVTTVTASGSILTIGNDTALGTTAGGTEVGGNNGVLNMQGGITVTGEALTMSPSNAHAVLHSLSGVNTWDGDITLTTGTATRGVTFSAAAGASLIIDGDISVTSAAGIIGLNPASSTTAIVRVNGQISGPTSVGSGSASWNGNVYLTGLNSYTGASSIGNAVFFINTIKNVGGGASSLGAPTTVANGTISIGASNQAGILTYTGTGDTTDRIINLVGGGSYGGTLDQSGAGLLKFTGDMTATSTTSTSPKPLVFRGSTAGVGEFAGVISDGLNTTGGVSVVKDGTGTWIFSGANSYAGATTVNSGKLLYNGTLSAGANGVTVNNTATLGGTGTINRAVTIAAGGHVAPGASIESLDLASLNMAAGSFFDFEFDNASYDELLVAGALTLPTAGTPVKFNLLAEDTTTAWDFDGTYNLIRYGSLVNAFDPGMMAVNNPVDGVTYTFQTANVEGYDYVQLTISGGQVPEPATMAFVVLGGLGMLGASTLRRKRRA